MNKKTYITIASIILALAVLAGCASQKTYFRLEPSLQRDVKSIKGVQYVPLVRLCDAYGMQCAWDTFTHSGTLRGRGQTIVVRSGSDRILVNGVEQKLDRPVMTSGAVVYVPVSFARRTLAQPSVSRTAASRTAASARPQPEAAAQQKKFTIRSVVLDTGHGGKDVGATGAALGLREKDVALALSKRIRQVLEENGIRVTMTRGGDTFIPLPGRAAIANAGNADIFVSVHVNASRSRFMRGFECYYLADASDDNARALAAFEDSSLKVGEGAGAEHSMQLDKTLWDMTLTENRMESAELAGYICQSVEESLLIKNRGVRTARFYVLKNTRIPAVLVEAGYISNRAEEAKFSDPAFVDRLAEAIARGILQYRQRYEETEAFTNV